jgi:thiol-disulfide isomerase/thioredoxin
MSKSKRQRRKQTPTRSPASENRSRWLIGGVVLVALVAVIGIKALTRFTVASEASEQGTMEMPMQGAEATAPTPPGATAGDTASVADPFPSDPAEQVSWALRNGKTAMVLFHSTSCIPCKQMSALVATVRGDYEPDIVFVDVVVSDRANMNLIRQAGIQTIPTTFFVDLSGQGKRYVGALREDALRAELSALLQGG